jgi:hypothetical protein
MISNLGIFFTIDKKNSNFLYGEEWKKKTLKHISALTSYD